MKKWPLLILLLSLMACNSKKTEHDTMPVVTVSILPETYFVEKIAGNLVRVSVLIPPGASPATYEPTASQLKDLGRSDCYIKIGHLGFELSWMDRIRSVNPEMSVVDLSEGIELIVGKGGLHAGVDPHIWLSARNAKIMAENILRAMQVLLPGQTDILARNYHDFLTEIEHLNDTITTILEGLENRSFMTYHPSLSYYARDYDLRQYPLEIDGKSPSSAYLKDLADIGENEGIEILFLQMQLDQHNAEVLAKEIGAEIIQINPLDPDWYHQMIYITNALKAGADE
ncbi:MAG: zinc ABC transporter substrate-binding protein [Bacteroidales bacterium]|nr:zinc ABC transporter substrate-binding protein [Bacteroidales bacterium]